MNISVPIFLLVTAAAPVVETKPVASPSASVSTVAKVRLEVDHSALLAQQMAAAAENSAYFVRDDGAKALRERHGVDVVDSEDAPTIVVKLAWKDYEGSVYLIEIATRRPSEGLQVVDSFEAMCINNSALTKVVLEKFPAALEQLEESSNATPPDDVGDTTVEPSEPKMVDEPVDYPARAPLGPKGKAGIGLLVAGTVGVVTGGIVFAQRRQLDEGTEAYEELRGRDFAPPGVGVMVAGGVVAVTGAVLLILDRKQARRTRKVAEAPWLVPTSRGLALVGRF